MTQRKTVLITGANRGIGLSLAKLYCDRDHHVIATCRDDSNLKSLEAIQIVKGVDVAETESLAKIQSALGDCRIDLLINNAGVLRNEVLGDIDYNSIRSQFEVNALGPLRVSESLIPHFNRPAKIMMITSRMGSIEDNSSGGRYGYRMSKVALNIAAVSLSHDLKSREIAVGIIHPGLVGTDMIGGAGDLTPDQAAERIAERIDQLNLSNSGTFWHSNGERLPW